MDEIVDRSVAVNGEALGVVSWSSQNEKSFGDLSLFDMSAAVPYSRWDVNSTGAPRFAALASAARLPDAFDEVVFGIPTAEAILMDPQQRVLLLSAAEAFVKNEAASECGVAIGIGSADYSAVAKTAGHGADAFSFTSHAASVASGRLAFQFGLHGATASIDTACSSSLVAAQYAQKSGNASSLVGGVVVLCHVDSTASLQRAG